MVGGKEGTESKCEEAVVSSGMDMYNLERIAEDAAWIVTIGIIAVISVDNLLSLVSIAMLSASTCFKLFCR